MSGGVTALSRVIGPWASFASPHRSELARAVLVTLVLLAASPFHAPFCSFDQGHHGHAHAQAAAQKPVHPHSTVDLPSLPVSWTRLLPSTQDALPARSFIDGRRTLRAILRL
jgi:hypothetical protein